MGGWGGTQFEGINLIQCKQRSTVMLFAEPGVKASVFSWTGLKSRKSPGGCCSCAALSRIAAQDTERCRETLFLSQHYMFYFHIPPCILLFKECGMVTVNKFVPRRRRMSPLCATTLE